MKTKQGFFMVNSVKDNTALIGTIPVSLCLCGLLANTSFLVR